MGIRRTIVEAKMGRKPKAFQVACPNDPTHVAYERLVFSCQSCDKEGVKVERVEAADDSGDYAIITYDEHDAPMVVREFDRDGELLHHAYVV